MRARRLLAAAVLACAACVRAGAADFTKDGIGTAGSDFLTMDQGARGVAMGGAFTSVTNDANSLYWNPAGLTKVPRMSATFMYSPYLADISYQSGAFARRMSDSGVIAAGYRFRDLGSIMNTDLAGREIGGFRPRDYVGEVGWGQNVFDLSDSEVDVTMGATLRWIHSDYLLHSDGYAGDLGIQSRFFIGPYSYDLAAVAQNMGVGQNFDHSRSNMPFRYRMGGSMYLMRNLLLAVDAILPVSNVAQGALGAEYTMEAARGIKLAFRTGFNSLTLESLNVESTLSAGVGLTFKDLSFDYAFAPMGVLGDAVHRMSISWNLPAKSSRRYRER